MCARPDSGASGGGRGVPLPRLLPGRDPDNGASPPNEAQSKKATATLIRYIRERLNRYIRYIRYIRESLNRLSPRAAPPKPHRHRLRALVTYVFAWSASVPTPPRDHCVPSPALTSIADRPLLFGTFWPQPWFLNEPPKLVDHAAEDEGEPADEHQVTCAAMEGESMLVTGDKSGCICVWDVGGEELRSVASLPPPDAERPQEHLVRCLAISDIEGGVTGLAGRGIFFTGPFGTLTKLVPIEKRELSRLSHEEWDKYDAPRLSGSLAELSELGLTALDLNDEGRVHAPARSSVP